MFVFAFRIRALRHRAGLQPFFNQVAATALRAFLGNRLAPCHEIAFRIAIATVKRLPALGPALDYFAFRAIRAWNTDRLLLDVLASRVIAAGYELAIAAEFLHQIIAALWTLFFQRNVLALLSPDLFRRLALRVAGTGKKLS